MAREEELARELRMLGLTGYESKCYVFLVKMGPSDPRNVAFKASVPYPSAYEALSRLREAGWVELVRRRPALYRARDPSTILDEIGGRLKTTFAALESMYQATPSEQAELVYTLQGKPKVLSKLTEMIRGAASSLMLVTPIVALEESPVINREIRAAVERGVAVRVITDEADSKFLPREVEARTGNIVAFDLLVDDKTALIGLPDFSACGWAESSAIASHFAQFLELLWTASTEITALNAGSEASRKG